MLRRPVDGIDLSGFERVGGTRAGAYYQVEPGILLALPRPGYRQNAPEARASLEEAERIARAQGRRQVVIVWVDRVRNQDAASRRVWSEESTGTLIAGLALVAASMMGRAIGSFFMGLNRPQVPTAMFATWEQALAWARAIANERRDDPLE